MNEPFVIVYDDKSVKTASEATVSRMFDLADCDAMDGVAGIYAVDDACNLVRVTVGPQTRDGNWDSEETIYFASAPVKAGKRLIGYIHYSNH